MQLQTSRTEGGKNGKKRQAHAFFSTGHVHRLRGGFVRSGPCWDCCPSPTEIAKGGCKWVNKKRFFLQTPSWSNKRCHLYLESSLLSTYGMHLLHMREAAALGSPSTGRGGKDFFTRSPAWCPPSHAHVAAFGAKSFPPTAQRKAGWRKGWKGECRALSHCNEDEAFNQGRTHEITSISPPRAGTDVTLGYNTPAYASRCSRSTGQMFHLLSSWSALLAKAI